MPPIVAQTLNPDENPITKFYLQEAARDPSIPKIAQLWQHILYIMFTAGVNPSCDVIKDFSSPPGQHFVVELNSIPIFTIFDIQTGGGDTILTKEERLAEWPKLKNRMSDAVWAQLPTGDGNGVVFEGVARKYFYRDGEDARMARSRLWYGVVVRGTEFRFVKFQVVDGIVDGHVGDTIKSVWMHDRKRIYDLSRPAGRGRLEFELEQIKENEKQHL